MDSIIIKRGDTLILPIKYTQTVDSVVSDVILTGITVTVSITPVDGFYSIEVSSSGSNELRSVVVTPLVGSAVFTFKDTEVLVEDTYYIDFKLTTVDGIEQTSKSIKLLVKDKLV